jgi:hypothetical protein
MRAGLSVAYNLMVKGKQGLRSVPEKHFQELKVADMIIHKQSYRSDLSVVLALKKKRNGSLLTSA